MWMYEIGVVLFLAGPVWGHCPIGGYYDPATAKCFLFSDSTTDWFTAKYTCEMKGAFLAKVESQAEMDFMASVKPTAYYWMGINDLETEDVFKWLDGSLVTWFGWKSNQPNGGTTQNCTTIDNRWEWQDKECENPYYFVCNPLPREGQYGSQQLATVSDISSISSIRVTDRIDCASQCIQDVGCVYWAFSSATSSSNCKLYELSPGSSFTVSSSWDYYKMEWIKLRNTTSS